MIQRSKITAFATILLVICGMVSVQAALDDSVVLYISFDGGEAADH